MRNRLALATTSAVVCCVVQARTNSFHSSRRRQLRGQRPTLKPDETVVTELPGLLQHTVVVDFTCARLVAPRRIAKHLIPQRYHLIAVVGVVAANLHVLTQLLT